MTFRWLTWKQLKEAREANGRTALAAAKEMGVEFLSALQSSDNAVKAAAAVAAEPDAKPDPLALYDQATLLRYGIAAWSYGAPVSPATVDDLDAVTAEWAARRIAEINTPATGADRKNG